MNPPPLHPSETRSDVRQDRERDAGVPFEETQELSPWQLQHVELVGRDDRGRSWVPVEQHHLSPNPRPTRACPGDDGGPATDTPKPLASRPSKSALGRHPRTLTHPGICDSKTMPQMDSSDRGDEDRARVKLAGRQGEVAAAAVPAG